MRINALITPTHEKSTHPSYGIYGEVLVVIFRVFFKPNNDDDENDNCDTDDDKVIMIIITIVAIMIVTVMVMS